MAVVCVELQFHFMVTCKEFGDCLGGCGGVGGCAYPGNHRVSELLFELLLQLEAWWFRLFVQRQHLTHSFSGSDGASDQVKAFCYIFSSVEREQAGKQQIIKLMSTFIAVKAVKASHGFLIKSHKAYLQSHIIFLVIQTRNCLSNSMCSAKSFMTRRTGSGEGGGAPQTSRWGWREPCLFEFVWFIDSGKMPFGHYPKGQKLQFCHFVGKRQGRYARAKEPNNVPSFRCP